MELSEKIEKLLKSRGISRYKLSKETEIPYTTLTQILNGRTKDPQVGAIELLADFFGVTVDYLIGKSASSIIERQINEIGKTLEDVAKETNISLTIHRGYQLVCRNLT